MEKRENPLTEQIGKSYQTHAKTQAWKLTKKRKMTHEIMNPQLVMTRNRDFRIISSLAL